MKYKIPYRKEDDGSIYISEPTIPFKFIPLIRGEQFEKELIDTYDSFLDKIGKPLTEQEFADIKNAFANFLLKADKSYNEIQRMKQAIQDTSAINFKSDCLNIRTSPVIKYKKIMYKVENIEFKPNKLKIYSFFNKINNGKVFNVYGVIDAKTGIVTEADTDGTKIKGTDPGKIYFFIHIGPNELHYMENLLEYDFDMNDYTPYSQELKLYKKHIVNKDCITNVINTISDRLERIVLYKKEVLNRMSIKSNKAVNIDI